MKKYRKDWNKFPDISAGNFWEFPNSEPYTNWTHQQYLFTDRFSGRVMKSVGCVCACVCVCVCVCSDSHFSTLDESSAVAEMDERGHMC